MNENADRLPPMQADELLMNLLGILEVTPATNQNAHVIFSWR
jgi:hypothetical protein